MNDKEIERLDKVVESLNTVDDKYRDSMGRLLDHYSNTDNAKFAHSAMMGGTESYVASVSLEWFANKVRFASQLPLFDKNKDDDDRVIINEQTADEVFQRPLDWSRQAQLTQYLITSPKHKFPPALVVISQPWVDNPNADEWDEDGRALVSSANFKAFDSQGKFGMLDVSDSMQIFALDGQHRLLGVKGLKQLINGEPLPVKSRLGADLKDQITVDLLKERFNVDRAYIQSLGSETMGVEFISAVSEGETREEAKQRVRSIFVHVNKQAQKLKQGDLAQLDEDNGFNIVGRKVAVSHDLLSNERVNWNDKQISARSTKLTTLVAVTEMSRNLLIGYFPNWDPMIKHVPPQRPAEEHLEYGQKVVSLFFDKLGNLPSISKMRHGTPTAVLRNFPTDKNEVDPKKEPESPGEANILFRPVGQQALAKAIGDIISEETKKIELDDGTLDQSVIDDISDKLDELFAKLSDYDEQGKFSFMNEPNSLWYGVFYDFFNKKIRVKGEKLAVLLIKHLLRGESDPDDRENLRKELAEVRRNEDDEYKDFDGNKVSEDKIKLPHPI
jgi:DGQHR domain-containing protein